MDRITTECAACKVSAVGVCGPCERIRDERHLEACEVRAKCGASRLGAYAGPNASQRGFWAALVDAEEALDALAREVYAPPRAPIAEPARARGYRAAGDVRDRWTVTSRAGVVLGAYAAANAEEALDALARDAGYPSHTEACAATGEAPDDWTSDLGSFRREPIALLVQLVAQ